MNYRDQAAATNLTKCACGRPILKPKRKCLHCKKTTKYTHTTLRAQKTPANKPDKPRTRRAKRQNSQILGTCPDLRLQNWSFN
jgi:hypothetical protein